MAHILADRIRETSVTTGTGNFTLAGAVTRFRTVAAAVANSDTWPYVIEHETLNEWEEGVATQLTSTTFSRSPILSSNSNALVDFSAGTKQVFLTAPALTSFLRLDGGTMTGTLVAPLGLVGTPSITFTGDLDTGLYRAAGGDNVSLTVGGTLRLGVTTTEITSTLPVSIPSANTPATPALYFGTNTNTGIYQPAADNIGFSTNSTLRLTIGTTAITPTLVLTGADGTNTAPAYSFSSDPNTGMYSGGADIISFATNSTQRITINDVGAMKFFSVGTTTNPIIRFGNNSYGFNWDGSSVQFISNNAVRGYFNPTVFSLSIPLSVSHNSASGNTIAQQGVGTALTITNTGTGNSLVVEDSNSTDSTPFVIDNVGNVAIGTAIPTAKLHVVGDVLVSNATSGSIAFNSTTAANRSLVFQTNAVSRWLIETSGDAESGSNAGSHLRIQRRDDAGAAIEYVLHIARDTGVVTIGGNGAGGAITERLYVQSMTSNTAESLVRLTNTSTNSAATVDLHFATGAAPGSTRSLIRGHRAGSNGDLSLITMLAAAEVVNLKLTSNGQSVFAAAPTAAAPAITFSGDTDTGLYLFGTNSIGFATAGAYTANWSATELRMNTNIVVTKSNAMLALDTTGASDFSNRAIQTYTGGVTRWSFQWSTGTESGSNSGGDVVWQRYDDAGTLISGNAFHMSRATGNTTFAGQVSSTQTAPTDPSHFTRKDYVDSLVGGGGGGGGLSQATAQTIAFLGT